MIACLRAKQMPKKRKWRMRSLGLFLCLNIVAIGLLLDQILISKWTENLLKKQLAAKGIELELGHLQWRGGLIAKDVHLRLAGENPQASMFSKEVKFHIQWAESLFGGKPKFDSIILNDAHFDLPFWDDESRAFRHFMIEDISVQIASQSSDRWLLKHFKAECLGIKMEVEGEIKNAFGMKNWFQKSRSSQLPNFMKRLMNARNEVKFDEKPMLQMTFFYDASQAENASASLKFSSDASHLSWGGVKGFSIIANTSFGNCQDEILKNTSLKSMIFKSTIEVKMSDLIWENGSLDHAQIRTDLRHCWLDLKMAKGEYQTDFQGLHSRFATMEKGKLDGRFAPAFSEISAQSLGPFELFHGWEMDWKLAGNAFKTRGIEAKTLSLTGHWKAPDLEFKSVEGTFDDGKIKLDSLFSADTRMLKFEADLDFDPHKISPFLSPKSRNWLEQYEFEVPPEISLCANLRLPKWEDCMKNLINDLTENQTNNQANDWREKLKSTMHLNGNFKVGKGAFRGIPVRSASSSIVLTNMVWQLPDLHIRRSEGELFLDYRCDAKTQDYLWKISADFDFKALTPLLSASQKKALDLFTFEKNIQAEAEIRGRWHVDNLTRFKGKMVANDLWFRGVEMQTFRTDFAYVNGLLMATGLTATRDDGVLEAGIARLDFRRKLVNLEGGHSTIDATLLAKMIGPKIEKTFAPYRFASPPEIHISGKIPLDKRKNAEARIEVSGGPFAFWRFEVPEISARIDWLGNEIHMNGVRSKFYGGLLKGKMWMNLDSRSESYSYSNSESYSNFNNSNLKNLSLTNSKFNNSSLTNLSLKNSKLSDLGVDFNLDVEVENANLNEIFKGIFSEKSRSQGSLSGYLKIDSGKTKDRKSWKGSGGVQLREGLLWDVPLFGIFSPILNTLSTGLGNSRAETAEASFRIDEGLLSTRDLMIQEPTTRLQYQGWIDFKGNLDARVEAELLRDTPMFGKVVSIALWPVSKLFVYQVSGNLNEPIAEPIYVLPKFLMNPIHSIKSRDD